MNKLVILKRENKEDVPVTTSKIIADGSENTHRSIYLLIDKYESDFKEFGVLSSQMTKLKNEQGGRPEKIYYLNENQALLLITYMRNNPIVRNLKITLVKEFSDMKKLLMQKETEEWQYARRQGKTAQTELNDSVKEFIDYARSQGSSSPERYYTNFTKLSNSVIGRQGKSRDYCEANTITLLTLVINTIKQTIRHGIADGMFYKKIYILCKNRALEIYNMVKPLLIGT
jgi:phage regulator Rha-like protein